ncbi:MAG: DUF4177 domain-containing protein [Candidatus Methanoplasma sp.]|jgi:hypothetical protein|nr:DUF4177 domain-containing protein [Candidatus Methanoplasma sp.]
MRWEYKLFTAKMRLKTSFHRRPNLSNLNITADPSGKTHTTDTAQSNPFSPDYYDLCKCLTLRNTLYILVSIINRYKSEVLKVSFKLIKSSIEPEEVTKLDELINKRASEGWDLVTYTFMGGGGGSDFGRGILVTFRRD